MLEQPAPLPEPLSGQMNRFARELRAEGLHRFEGTEAGVARLTEALARTFEMFAIDAKSMEDETLLLQIRLHAAGCHVEALTIPDFLDDLTRDRAIRDGVRAGHVIDLRAIFLDEQGFNAERREESTSDGDAA